MNKFRHLLFFQALWLPLFGAAQTIDIRGRVTDQANGEAMSGVTIQVKGTLRGSITTPDGDYSLKAEPKDSLVFSFVGYAPVVEPVGNRHTIHVQMATQALEAEPVVVIGYGGQKRNTLSTAVSSIQIGEEVKSQPVGLFRALQGQIPGVTISANGGDPLSGTNIVIRGQGSRTGDPILFVVDGVPGAPYNEQDVESVTVLKDAAAAAIYGANVGSGGVIIITTKKAKEGKINVSAQVQYGFQKIANRPDMLTAQEYARVRTDAAGVSGSPIPPGINPDIYPWGQVTRTDWIDEIFRTGQTQRYYVSLSGGGKTLRAMTSIEYNRAQGVMLNTYNSRLGMINQIEYTPNDWLTISERVSYGLTDGQGGVGTGHTGVLSAAMFYPRSATVYEMDQAGNYVLDANGERMFGGTVPLWAGSLGVGGTFGEIQNPVAQLLRLNQRRPDNNLFSTTTLKARIMDGLTLKSDFTGRGQFRRYEDFSMRRPELGKPDLNNSRTITNDMNSGWLWETVANFDRSFGRHSLSAMAGASLKYDQWRGNGNRVSKFPDENPSDQHFTNGTDWTEKPWESFAEESSVGAFARAAYSFGDRYFVTASIRYDATSKLYQQNNAGFFPAVSAAWKISSEKFMKDQTVVSLLKLRGSWGRIGNVASVNNYSYVVSLNQLGGAYIGNNNQTFIQGVGLSTIANLGLKWETSEQTDIGLDLGLFENRLTATVDYFVKDTKDLIEDMPVPSVAGLFQAPKANIGKVQNRGWEFSLGYNNRTSFGLTYSLNGNLAILHNEVKDLGPRDFYAHTNTVRAIQPLQSTVGESWHSYYLIATDGLFRTQAEIDNYVKRDQNGAPVLDAGGNTIKVQPRAQVGDLKFVDQNGDGIISDADRVYMGSYTPKYTYGFTAQFEWRGIDLSFQIQGVGGNKIFNGVKVMTFAPGQGWNLSSEVLNSYNYNPNSNLPLLSMTDSNGNTSTPSDFFLENGAYTRLKNLTVGYTFPEKWLKSYKLRVFFSGENLATFTQYSGMDPEVGNYGIDGGVYPLSRIFSFGATLKF